MSSVGRWDVGRLGTAALLLLVAAVCALDQGGLLRLQHGAPWVEVMTWIFFLVFLSSTLGNLLSSSPSERRLMTPVAFVLTLAFLAVGLGW